MQNPFSGDEFAIRWAAMTPAQVEPAVDEAMAHAQAALDAITAEELARRQTTSLAAALGIASYAPVLFGGVVASVFSVLQFVFAPFWGELSDRRGRRGVLLFTVAGTAASYLLWALSGSFWLFLLSRLVSGAFSGNLSVATAAVADVRSLGNR